MKVPEDILIDILSRLPAKSLGRFKSVSRSWLSLIEDPYFIKIHVSQSLKTSSNLSIILLDSANAIHCADFDSFHGENAGVEARLRIHPFAKSKGPRTVVMGSCNGLLLLSTTVDDCVMWNPCNGTYRKLPPSLVHLQGRYPHHLVQYYCGFGYDRVTDDYKVVNISLDMDSLRQEVEVFCLKSNSWRKIPDCPYLLHFSGAIFVGDALHWIASENSRVDSTDIIGAFDLGNEQWRMVPQPQYSNDDICLKLGVLEGCLCVFCHCNYNFRFDTRQLDIWMMTEYGEEESWTQLCSVRETDHIQSFDYLNPIAYSRSGKEILLEQDNESFLWFDPEANLVKNNIQIIGGPLIFSAYVCLKSLVNLSILDVETAQQKAGNKKRKRRNNFLPMEFRWVPRAV